MFESLILVTHADSHTSWLCHSIAVAINEKGSIFLWLHKRVHRVKWPSPRHI